MGEIVSVITVEEKGRGKGIKVTYRKVYKKAILGALKVNLKSNAEVSRAFKNVERSVISIMLNTSCTKVTMILNDNNKLVYDTFEDVDMYYMVLDATSTYNTYERRLTEFKWDDKLAEIDSVNIGKTADDKIVIIKADINKVYKKKRDLDIGYIDRDTLLKLDGVKLHTTEMILRSTADILSKIILWDDEHTIGTVHNNRYRYALEISEESYKEIINKLLTYK